MKPSQCMICGCTPRRVFTFDIGFEGATDSIKELAQAGNGSVQVITSREKIQPTVRTANAVLITYNSTLVD